MTQIIEVEGHRIAVSYTCPPVPFRNCDWEASIEDGDYDYDWDGEGWIRLGTDPIGYGSTKEDAIQDLLAQLDLAS